MLIHHYKHILKIIMTVSFLSFANCSWGNGLPIYSGVGGDFSAINYNNQTMQLSDYNDKIILLAFGYTNCADICPFTLGYLKELYESLPKDNQKDVQVIFVSIDPEYDTPEHLKGFIEHFNKDFMGLTGSKEQIDHIVSLFQAQYQPLADAKIETKTMRRVNPKKGINVNEDKAKLFNHSVTIYVMDKQLRLRSLEYTGSAKSDFVFKIRELINE